MSDPPAAAVDGRTGAAEVTEEGAGRQRVGPAAFAVAVTVAVIFFSSSIKNSVQVFFVTMAETFEASRGEFAVSVSVFTIAYGLAAPVIGRVSDRIGARATIAGGVGVAAAMFVAAAATPWLPLFVVVYGVVGALAFSAMSYVPIGVLVDESFERRRRGLVYALLTNAAAVGFVFLSPAWVYLDRHVSWRAVYLALGLVFALVLLPLIRKALPAALGPAPASGDEGTETEEGTVAVARPAPADIGVRRVLRSRVFWVLALGFFGCGVTMAFIDVHMVAHMEHLHLSPAVISGSLAALGITEVGGAVVAGWLCDRFDKRNVLALSYLVRSLAMVILVASPSAAGALAFGAVFGLSYMGSVIATTFCAIDALGDGAKGLAIGLLWLVHQIGAFSSTQLGATAFDATGSYRLVMLLTAVVAMTAAAVSVLGLAGGRLAPHASSAEASKVT